MFLFSPDCSGNPFGYWAAAKPPPNNQKIETESGTKMWEEILSLVLIKKPLKFLNGFCVFSDYYLMISASMTLESVF